MLMFWILLPQNVRTFGRRCGLVANVSRLAAMRAAVSIGLALLVGVAAVAGQQQPDPAAIRQLAAAGERALADGRYREAQNAYETLRGLTPGNADVHARLGLIHFQQGQFTEAIPPLREALRLRPALPKVEALLAMSLSELGRYNEALPGVRKAFAQSADTVLRRMAGLHLQRIYTGLGRDQDAVDVALRLVRLYPDDPEVLYHSGRLFANFAYVQTMRLATVAPGSVWLHQAAGEANESQGLHDAALREYEQVVAASPRRPGIRFRIGRVLLARAKATASADDLAGARKAFEEELALDPSNANAAYELGEMDRTAGEFQSARRRFEQAVSHYPGFEHALIGLGRTLIALDQPQQALQPLQDALKANPESDVALYQIAQAYRALGNTAAQERALGEFNRLRRIASQRKVAIPETMRDVTPQLIDRQPPR